MGLLLPQAQPSRETMADAGALFSFGPSIFDRIRRSAHWVDRVLHDTRPADIPVEAADRLRARPAPGFPH